MAYFSSLRRTDSEPKRHAEPTHAFLDRVDDVFFGRCRELLDQWHSAYPNDQQRDLAARLSSRDDDEMLAAFWELYLFRALTESTGRRPVCHPELEGTSAQPDFLVPTDSPWILEATTTREARESVAADRRCDTLYDALDKMASPNFFIGIQVSSAGTASPPGRRLRHELASWLATLDPDDVERAYGETRELPHCLWQNDGWDVRFEAIPKRADARGRAGVRPLGMFGSGVAEYIDSITPIRSALSTKGPKYGRTGRPYVIALLPLLAWEPDDEDVNQALLGTIRYQIFPDDRPVLPVRDRDGFWGEGRHDHVSALLIATRLKPWSVASVTPTLWVNPWAAHPVNASEFPWCRVISEEGVSPPRRPVHELLGLPAEWPGPEQPFEMRA